MTFRIKIFVDHILSVPVRPVINSLSFLIFHHLLFFGKHGFCYRVDKVAQLIGLGPDHFFKGIIGDGLKIIGAIPAGRTIGTASAYAGTQFIESAFAQIFRFQEQQVFKKVGKSCSSFFFAGRAHMAC